MNNKDLLKKFKELENKLLEILKVQPVDFDENVSRAVLKKNIGKYIKKVNEAKKVFEEYEKIAKEIENLAIEESKENIDVSKAVVELREIGEKLDKKSVALGYAFEDEPQKSEIEQETYESEQVVDEKMNVSVKRKKKKNSEKEF